MKRLFGCLSILLLLLQTGCMDRVDVENLSLALIIGLDLDDENNLVVSTSSPVFSREAKRKTEVYETKAISLRTARDEFDKTFKAFTSGGKTQVFLIGKKLMSENNWFALLDPFLREPKNTSSTKIVLVDGPVSPAITYNPQDKPRLPIYLTYLIDTASHRNLCVRTTLQDFASMTRDKGMTASVTELRFTDRINIVGSALLNEQGLYKLSITPEETRMLRMLQNEKAGDFTFTFEHEEAKPSGGPIPSNLFSVDAMKFSNRLKTGFSQDRFTFDFRFKIRVAFAEKLFPFDVLHGEKLIEAEMERQFVEKFERLIRKFQKAKIDPIGLGQYARGYRYGEWKKVEEEWGRALSRADVNVKVDVTIAAMGSIR